MWTLLLLISLDVPAFSSAVSTGAWDHRAAGFWAVDPAAGKGFLSEYILDAKEEETARIAIRTELENAGGSPADEDDALSASICWRVPVDFDEQALLRRYGTIHRTGDLPISAEVDAQIAASAKAAAARARYKLAALEREIPEGEEAAPAVAALASAHRDLLREQLGAGKRRLAVYVRGQGTAASWGGCSKGRLSELRFPEAVRYPRVAHAPTGSYGAWLPLRASCSTGHEGKRYSLIVPHYDVFSKPLPSLLSGLKGEVLDTPCLSFPLLPRDMERVSECCKQKGHWFVAVPRSRSMEFVGELERMGELSEQAQRPHEGIKSFQAALDWQAQLAESVAALRGPKTSHLRSLANDELRRLRLLTRSFDENSDQELVEIMVFQQSQQSR